MQEWIKEKIAKVEGLKDRRVLRDAVAGAFVEVDEYNKNLYKMLESRLKEELSDYRIEFDVYSAVCKKDDYDPINDFLFPMDDADVEIAEFEPEELAKRTSLGEEVCLTTIFLECETKKIKQLISQKKMFAGKIYYNGGMSEVKLALRECTRYKLIVEEVYKSFMFNDIAWKTLNAPYLEKFVDVVAIDFPVTEENSSQYEIEVDLLDYEPYKLMDRIPLWNIRNLSTKPTFFPMPAYDTINYEHTISLKELGGKDNYIVKCNNSEVLYVKRNKDELVVVAAEDRVREWELFALHSPREEKMHWITQSVFSNARNQSFLERYEATLAMKIRSRGELERLLNSFKCFKGWKLAGVEMQNTKVNWSWKNSNDVNFFIADHVRVEEEKTVLELCFETIENDDYIIKDKMQFFISEVQLAFPDYACVGKLVKNEV